MSSSTQFGLDCSVHDPVGQRVTTQHVMLGPGGLTFHPVELRYARPAELDLMATVAGLEPTVSGYEAIPALVTSPQPFEPCHVVDRQLAIACLWFWPGRRP